jgi:hypothetical protein
MGQAEDLVSLRARVSSLTEREGTLLAEAFALSRASGDRSGVEPLFAQVQSIQIERSGVKQRIAQLLGTRRLQLAAEVWQPGTYDYSPAGGTAPVRVVVRAEALGLYVTMPGGACVRIEALNGTFDGPFDAEEPSPSAGKQGTR